MTTLTKRFFSLLCSAAILSSLLPASALAAGFSDVPQNAYYQDAVDWAVQSHITAGTSASAFSPDAVCTRAQAVTFLWRSEGEPDTAGSTPFADVTAGSYYADAVQWATANGITSGTSSTTFDPDAPVTRAQVVTFLYRSSGSPAVSSATSFADVFANAYYADAVRWAVAQGITTGTSAGTFSPDMHCTRAQIVTFLYRASDASPEIPEPEIPEEPEVPEEDPVLPEEPVQPRPELTEEEIEQLLSEPNIEGASAAIINGLRNMEKRIDLSAYNISTTDAMDLAAEVADADGENPYFLSSIWATRDTDDATSTTLVLSYQYTPEGAAEKRKQDAEEQAVVDAAIAACVTEGMSDYEIAKALHDYLALNCEYDMRLYSGDMPLLSRTAYGALVNHTAVCSGYALAYQHLMEDAGIPCEYITGMTTSGYHGWNIVQIDGAWYHVDVTWDDPITYREDFVRYDYFLKSDSSMSRDHLSWDASHACTSTKYDNAVILSPAEEQEAIEKAEEQARQEAVINEILSQCRQAIAGFPYMDEAELQAAENLTADDWTDYIYFPADQYSYTDMHEAFKQLDTIALNEYPKLNVNTMYQEDDGTRRWCIEIYRDDVIEEMERRQALAQEEKEKHIGEVELLLQEAIRNAEMANYTYQVAGYTDEEISEACRRMIQQGYAFSEYTNADYNLGARTDGWVSIVNIKWRNQEIERQAEIIRKAIRNRQPEVILQGQYEDHEITEYYYAFLASDLVGKEGYTFDGLTAGVDYTLKSNISHDSSGAEAFTVHITYLNEPSDPTPESSDTPAA